MYHVQWDKAGVVAAQSDRGGPHLEAPKVQSNFRGCDAKPEGEEVPKSEKMSSPICAGKKKTGAEDAPVLSLHPQAGREGCANIS
jgi:hypothetical protein